MAPPCRAMGHQLPRLKRYLSSVKATYFKRPAVSSRNLCPMACQISEMVRQARAADLGDSRYLPPRASNRRCCSNAGNSQADSTGGETKLLSYPAVTNLKQSSQTSHIGNHPSEADIGLGINVQQRGMSSCKVLN